MIAQNLGNHSSTIEWQTIENENARIIFPKQNNAQAKRIADVIDYINKNASVSVGSKSKKIDVVLQTQQVISNGFVTLSPFRSELFGTAPQNFSALGSTDWLDLLTVHEYRHVLQMANANRGLTKALHILSGQNGWSAGINLMIPNWYLEGDAVLSETLLSENGRGRNPSFFKEQRALLLNDQFYSYAKAQNGSYKNLLPNIYSLGFVINNYIRNNYGTEVGKKILVNANGQAFRLYPFSSSMKKQTGIGTRKMYKKAYASLQKKIKKEADQLDYTPYTVLTKSHKTPTHYLFPHYLEDGSIVCLKTSFNEIPKIIQIKNKKVKFIGTVGVSPQLFLSSTKNKLTWTTLQKDIRRGNTNYSNICIFDLNTKSKKTITKNGKYFSPNISNDLSKIIAVHVDKNLKNKLVILDAETGKILDKIANPKNDFFSYPKWSSYDKEIIYLIKRNSKLAFFKYNFAAKKTTQLSKWTAHTIENFTLLNDTIYFTASFSGIDNIYSLKNNKIEQISSVKVGAYTPNISSNEKIIYSDFTLNGHQINELDLNTITPRSIAITAPKNQKNHDIKTTNIEHAILDSIPVNSYEQKNYKGFFKGLKLHSWGFNKNSNLSSAFSVGLQFQNILSDFYANTAVLFNANEKSTGFIANATYSKYFIELNVNTSKTNRNAIFVFPDNITSLDFSETKISGGISIPLSKIKGNYYQSFRFSTNYSQHLTSGYSDNTVYNELNFGALESSLTLYNARQTAYQNLAPKFGQYFNITFKKGISTDAIQQTSLQSTFYFPGLFKNHSTQLIATWQKENLTNQYKYPNTFSFARGYESLLNDDALKISANYEFPILYPDWGFWGLTYFKRIRGNIFFDYNKLDRAGKIIITTNNNTFELPASVNRNSYGGELIFDNTYLNVLPISIGLRQSFLLNQDIFSRKKSDFSLFFQLNF
ncbi:hypothetical protein ACFLRU_05280 [Bacteroidota bacterium]